MATVKDVEADAQVTYEDQQKINKFARHNARLNDIKEELIAKKKELQNLDDAGDELVLQDDDQPVPYQIGEFFIMASTDEANNLVEDAKKATQNDIKELEDKANEHKGVLSDLKIQLYAKFGNNINLEAEED